MWTPRPTHKYNPDTFQEGLPTAKTKEVPCLPPILLTGPPAIPGSRVLLNSSLPWCSSLTPTPAYCLARARAREGARLLAG